MSVEMHEEFNALYHCPTAVRLPQLDYNAVQMVLIGDPRMPGCLVNDGLSPAKSTLLLRMLRRTLLLFAAALAHISFVCDRQLPIGKCACQSGC